MNGNAQQSDGATPSQPQPQSPQGSPPQNQGQGADEAGTEPNTNADAKTDFSDRHVRISSPYVGEVVVRDDRADLEDLEATANRFMDRLENQHETYGHETESARTYE